MTRSLGIAFVLNFLAGPALFLALQSIGGGRRLAAFMAGAVGVLCLAAVQSDAVARLFPAVPPAAIALTALWLAWIFALALLARAARVRLADAGLRRTVLLCALLATPLPWFGYATAQLINA